MKRQIIPDDARVYFVMTPLIITDIRAYEISYNSGIGKAGAKLKITAERADGLIVNDECYVGEDGVVSYTLHNNMHAVPGRLKVDLQFIKNGSQLTDKTLYFTVVN